MLLFVVVAVVGVVGVVVVGGDGAFVVAVI